MSVGQNLISTLGSRVELAGRSVSSVIYEMG